MAATTGQPAIMAFCSSSKLARPDSSTHSLAPGQVTREQRRAHQLVHGVVPAHVLAAGEQLAVGGEQPDRVHAAGLGEAGLRLLAAYRASPRSTDSLTMQVPLAMRRSPALAVTASMDALPQTPQLDVV